MPADELPGPKGRRPAQPNRTPPVDVNTPPDRRAAEPRILRSEDLLLGTREVTILHGGEAYRLRLTSNEKLILTK